MPQSHFKKTLITNLLIIFTLLFLALLACLVIANKLVLSTPMANLADIIKSMASQQRETGSANVNTDHLNKDIKTSNFIEVEEFYVVINNSRWVYKSSMLNDEDTYEVQWRNSYSCSDDCWSADEFSTSTSGWKDIQLKTSGDYINVSVAGQTFSYNLKGDDKNWPSDGGYFWKTGIYIQDEGTAYTGYQNIYW